MARKLPGYLISSAEIVNLFVHGPSVWHLTNSQEQLSLDLLATADWICDSDHCAGDMWDVQVYKYRVDTSNAFSSAMLCIAWCQKDSLRSVLGKQICKLTAHDCTASCKDARTRDSNDVTDDMLTMTALLVHDLN